MCGIALLNSRFGPIHPSRLQSALGLLTRRGPDGSGIVSLADGQLMLGHQRLAIFDPTTAGLQPMIEPSTGSALIFNGAIYNFIELAAELADCGYRFRTRSDTEVILAAWARWGLEAFQRFNGMWAIALWDQPTGRLILSRDRLGVKPLYLLDDGQTLAAASTVRATLAAAGQPWAVRSEAVFDFLALGLSDDGGPGFAEGVIALPPGEAWVYHREGRVQRHRWHQWPDPAERTQAPSPDLAALIVEATRLRLRADAPTRLLLSGGLDSAIVAASAAEVLGDQRQHFRGALVYGYGPDHLADETAGATAVAERYRLDLARLTVTPVPDRADLDGLMDAQEEPFTTPSLVGLYRIARALADEGVKVALTGEGSDELFAGYTRRYAPLTALAALSRGNVRTPWALLRGKHTSPKNLAAALAWRLGPRVAGQVLRRSHPSAACIARDVWHRHQDRLEDYCRDRSQDLGARLSTDVIRTGLPAILRYGDRSGMAFGVEVRSPFLDYRVVEAALRLDPAHLLDARGGKVPLRMAFADRLPMDRIGWQKRAGLGQAEQFTIGALAIQDLLDDPPAGAADWLDLSRLRRQLAAMPSNPVLWLPIALLLWLRARERW